MKFKENLPESAIGGDELSAEQRARISQNFRAAKALLARKRQRLEPSDHPINNLQLGNENGSGIKRTPLSSISNNVMSPVTLKIPNSTGCYGSEMFATPGSGAKRSSSTACLGELCSFGVGVNGDGLGSSANLFVTPLKQEDGSNGVELKSYSSSGQQVASSNLTSCLVASAVLEDDFDESILAEIDGLGVKKQGLPMEVGSKVNSFVTPLRQDDCLNGFDLKSYSRSCEPNSSLVSSAVLEDDFDESILAEIDAICEQHSAGKSGKEDTAMNEMNKETLTEQDNAIITPDISDKILAYEHILDPGDDLVCGVKDVAKSEVRLSKSMPDEYAKYILSLNDRQQEAACSDISTPLVIVAGPGSGKTSTMVGRVLMLLNEGIAPSHILAMTFTTAAAAEMRERIAKVAGKAAAKMLNISTFHSFSLQLCRLHAEKLDRTPDFLIYGHGQQRKAIIEAVRLLEEGKRAVNVHTDLSDINSPKQFKDKSKKWLKFVTQAKAAGRSPEYFHKMGDETGAIILQNYSDVLKSCNALDYHDFISYSLKLLIDFPEVLNECQESWKAIVIDEFQDTSSMQYGLLRVLASHKRITVVGDEDQSIFGFNGADISGFDSFRKDFPTFKEVRLNKNYRSTRCIVEAASFLIRNNLKRCKTKDVTTDKSYGSKITVKECCNEDAQCAFVVDKILEITSDGSSDKCAFGNIAVLYRRQVTGKVFQTAFRRRNIPFNMHGVAFYRKKVVRAIIAMLSTTLPGCDDGAFRRVFKALLSFEKEETKKVIEHVDKVSTIRRCSFIAAAGDIFNAKISGTFKRSQLTQGRKVLLTLDMISKLAHREQSISAVITSVTNLIPQKYLLEQRAVLDIDGGKLLNEDNDLRSVLQYLLDDVSVFLTTVYNAAEGNNCSKTEGIGCMDTLKSFVDYISVSESENFRSRKQENEDSVTLTTIHQSKGLEWDTVFIVKTNEAEIPLLHEYNGTLNENCAILEEERRLFFVAMTRARKKLIMLHVLMNSSWQVLQPSRFLREIPRHLLETQDELVPASTEVQYMRIKRDPQISVCLKTDSAETNIVQEVSHDKLFNEVSEEHGEVIEDFSSNNFLKSFRTEDRAVVSHLFHQWAKKPAFHDPKRLLNKVGFVIDERLRAKRCTQKDVLRELKSKLTSEEALYFAVSVLKWEQLPAEKRAYITREKQEHFQKLRIESAMGSSEPTPKQISYIQSLGCTIVPSSRLHASRLIEEYKSL